MPTTTTRLAITTALALLGTSASAQESAEAARAVLSRHCQRCHHGPGSDGGAFDVLSHPQLVDDKTEQWSAPLVVPKDVEGSYLVERLAKGEMPPRSIKERPSEADVKALKAWVAAGAPDFPLEVARARDFVSLPDVLKRVVARLKKAPSDQRKSLRFFTLHHLHNDPKVPDDQLRMARAALSKAINSLHYKPQVVVPQSLGEDQLVFVVDLAALGWERPDLWSEVLRSYPYGLKVAEGHPDEGLRKLDEDLTELTGCELPIVRGDWFVASATRPPLYHAILNVPNNAHELEKRLGVDVAARFLDPDGRNETIARAAFARSGVSGQNRLVERLEGNTGAYWKSYDFKADSSRAKLTRFPLGPESFPAQVKNPFPFQAFRHDGGEIVFALPNGLQGYMLVDGKDDRIDSGPIEVVSDSLKTSGTPAIFNGVSCMACHKHGTVPFRDTLRDASAVLGAAEKHVKKLYPKPEVMDQLVQRDADRFLRALDKAVSPFLKVGPDKDRPLREFPDPVGEIARLYRLGFLDLKTVACELDQKDPQELLRRVGEHDFKALGLEALLKEGGVVGRLEWEARDGASLMQELARKLRFTPYNFL